MENVGNLVKNTGRIEKKWPQVVAKLFQVPWGYNRIIISKCKDIPEALYYVNKTIEHNWSRNGLKI